jgi:vacuolar-type H+-ATPase subunit C/Vma6
VIAVKEKSLLKERLYRLVEMTADEAFRALLEYGYGGGAETASAPHEYEALIEYEESLLDEFIREYAPTDVTAAYFLSPRDFHNAKALFKAKLLSVSAEKMLASEGLVPIAQLSSCVASSDYSSLDGELKSACLQAEELLKEETITGVELGVIFDKACYLELSKRCKRNATLRRFIEKKVDMINILIAVRARDFAVAQKQFLQGGKLSFGSLEVLNGGDRDRVNAVFTNTPYVDFVKECLLAKEKNLPLSMAEKKLASFETEAFQARKYELKKEEPFLYYVLGRRIENANIRILFAGKLAGLSETEIKRRLRAYNGGVR